MRVVLLRHPLEVGQQRSELLGIGEKVVNVIWLSLYFKFTAELDRHL